MTEFLIALVVLAFLLGLLGGSAAGWFAALRAATSSAEADRALAEVGGVRTEMERVVGLVQGLQVERAQQHGHLSARLEQAAHATAALASTTGALRDALASPAGRGQWGERMAEDILRAAGLVKGINYVTQTAIDGGTVPDLTFLLPGERVLHMDVKFPADNYLRHLESDDERHASQFLTDVRNRVREITGRGYVDPQATVPFVLLFIPNESIFGFVLEHDPGVVDWALERDVVLASPSSLFAVLAVIRQAADQFTVERRSREILDALRGLRHEWHKFTAEVDKMGRGLASATKAYEAFSGPRSRAFERSLDAIDRVPVPLPAPPGETEPPASERIVARSDGEPSYPHAV